MIEAQFQDKMIAGLRQLHCFVKPLVGNTLMAGMPDLWIANLHKWSGHVELKMWKNKYEPNCHSDFLKLLDGPQHYVIPTEFWQRGIHCPILALSKRDEVTAWIYYGDEVIHPGQHWSTFPAFFANLNKKINNEKESVSTLGCPE